MLTVNATGETLRITRQFEGEMPALFFGGDVSEDTGVNEIVFADGTVWLRMDMAMAVSHPDAGSTTVEGTDSIDYLDGAGGDDILRGGGDGDFYVFARGYGNDRIEDFENYILRTMPDVLILKDLNRKDIEFLRNGASNDLVIRIRDTGETVTIQDQFAATYTGPFGTQWMSAIEAIMFADGSAMMTEDVMAWLMETAGTRGNDIIYGFSREDVLDGGAGNDFLSGGNENDIYIFGYGYGHDVIQDGQNNILSGSQDMVRFRAGVGVDDVIFTRQGESEDLVIRLRGSNDTLTINGFYNVTETGPFGPWASDLIEIFRWADGTQKDWWSIQQALIASAKTDGDDLIAGTHFDDIIDGGRGNDILKGGNGSDTYMFNIGYGHDTIIDAFSNIFAGNEDRVVFGPGISAGDIAMRRVGDSFEDLRFTILATGETLTIQGQFGYSSINYRPNEIEYFEFADGTVWDAAALRREYLARAGTPGEDVITGFWSNDIIVGGAGNDILRGGDGSDTYRFEKGFGHDVIEESVGNIFYDDYDTVEFGVGLAASDARLSRSGGDLVITFAGGTDSLTIRGQFGTGTFPDWQDIELFKFADGTQWTDADIRRILLNRSITAGDDVIQGFFTADVIDGGAGNDRIDAGDGDDSITGGLGNDVLSGGAGNDTYYYARGDGHDTLIEDTHSGAADRLVLRGLNPGDVTLVRNGNDVTLMIAASSPGAGDAGSILLKDNFDDYWDQGVESIVFADGTVWTRSTLRAMLVSTVGTPGNDVLTGTNAPDTLIGGKGDDSLDGGAGNDTYIYTLGDGHDTIIDQGDWWADDMLVLKGIRPDEVAIGRNGSDIILTFADGGSIRLVGEDDGWGTGVERIAFDNGTVWTRQDLESACIARQVAAGATTITGFDQNNDILVGTAGNDTLSGLAGHDTLTGGKGDDTLNGGAGNDTYIYALGDGRDTIIDQGDWWGTDRLVLKGIRPEEVAIDRHDNGMVLTFADGGSITLVGQHEGWGSGIEQIAFDNGAVWSPQDLADAWLARQTVAGAGAESASVSLASALFMVDSDPDGALPALSGDRFEFVDDRSWEGTSNDATPQVQNTDDHDALAGGAWGDTFVFTMNVEHDVVIDYQAWGTDADMTGGNHDAFAELAALLDAAAQPGGGIVIAANAEDTGPLKTMTMASLHHDLFGSM